MSNDMRDTLAAMVTVRLEEEAERLRDEFHHPQSTKTRHAVLDDALPTDVAQSVYTAFPRVSNVWNQRNSMRERKKTFAKLEQVDPLISEVTMAFQQPNVVAAVAAITGINMLEVDPTLYAGGISMMAQDDFLNPHIDNSHDMNRKMYRRLNLLYYVTPDWTSANGGNLELWDEGVTKPVELVSAFNRLVIMETNRGSWHSVNKVRVEGERCCVSNYYFSRESPDGADYYHVTSFLGRPDEKLKRIVGRADNFARQTVATTLKTSRGKKYARTTGGG